MRWIKATLLTGAVLAAALLAWRPVQADIGIGDRAPDVAVVGTDGKPHTLLENVGNGWTVVAWFPKAFTAG